MYKEKKKFHKSYKMYSLKRNFLFFLKYKLHIFHNSTSKEFCDTCYESNNLKKRIEKVVNSNSITFRDIFFL